MSQYHHIDITLDKSIIDLIKGELKTTEKISYSVSKTQQNLKTVFFVNFFLKKQLILCFVFDCFDRLLNNATIDENTRKTILMLNPIQITFKCLKNKLNVELGNAEKDILVTQLQETLKKKIMES